MIINLSNGHSFDIETTDAPISVNNQTCKNGYLRPLKRIYSLDSTRNVQIDYTYIADAISHEFMGILNTAYTLISK